MRLLFILPYDNTYRRHGNFLRSLSYAPLTLAALAALVPAELNADITIVDEGVDKPVLEGAACKKITKGVSLCNGQRWRAAIYRKPFKIWYAPGRY